MTAATAGQAGYEARQARRLGVERMQPWEALSIAQREHEEAGAKAAIDWWHADRDLEPPRELVIAAQDARPAPGLRADAETCRLLRADLAHAEAQLARWPRCPDGCGCRLGTEDADARECACDGPCCMECREMGYPDAPSYRDIAAPEPEAP